MDGIDAGTAIRPGDHDSGSPRFRGDIQALRGVAILLVLAHHARIALVPGGFLGVDVFFVLSGFLMTTIITGGLDQGRFRLGAFYVRRIRRLLPATYATLTMTALAAPILLDSVEYRAFCGQLAGAFGFVANIVLWKQSDYFSTAAELKPLLHMWSLAVEEQFYLLLPPMLMIVPRRWRLPATLFLTLASLTACLFLVRLSPSITFYALPTRGWELGFGAFLALLVQQSILRPAPLRVGRMACGLLLLLIPLLTDEAGHPGVTALVICLATAVLLVPGSPFGNGWVTAPLRFAGDRSFSLYLVHWPIYAFANNVATAPLPMYVNLALLIPCFLIAELQFRLIEGPLRAIRMTRAVIALLVAIPLVVTGGSLMLSRHMQDGAGARAPNLGLSPACSFGDRFLPLAQCRQGDRPDAMIWGDSFGMHLADGMAASWSGGFWQATKTSCGPFIGIAPVGGALRSPAWAQGCLGFNESVLAFLRQHPEIRTVVLTSALQQYLPGEEAGTDLLVTVADGSTQVQPQSAGSLVDATVRTAAQLRSMGRRVILFAPPPSAGFDSGRCQLRVDEGKWSLPWGADCDFDQADYRSRRSAALAFLTLVERRGIMPVVSMDDYFCRGGRCHTRTDGVILFADQAHLSRAGSVLTAKAMKWGDLVRFRAK